MSAAEKDYKDYYVRRRDALSAKGLCIDCGKAPHTPTSRRCIRCSKRIAVYQRRYQAIKRLESQRPGIGASYADADGATFQEIADALGVSRSRAEQIYHRAMAKCWRECKRMGLDFSNVVGRGFSMLATAEKWA